MAISNKKNIVRIASIFLLIFALGVFIWGVGKEFASFLNKNSVESSEKVNPQDNEYELEIFSEVLALEGDVYDYINDELDLLLQAQEDFTEDPPPSADEDDELNAIGEVENINKQHLKAIAEVAMEKIERFFAANADKLTPSLTARLDKLRFSLTTRLTEDIVDAEKIIDALPASDEKLAIVTTYIAFFTKNYEERVEKFAMQQASWATALNNRYETETALSLFNAAPLGKKFPNHLANYYSVTQKNLSLENYKGKYVLVDFWASWCAPCVAELPYIKEMHSKFSPEVLQVVGISLDADREAFERFTKNYQVNWLQYFDGEAFGSSLAKSYGVLSLPNKFLLNEEGIVVMANNHAKEMLDFMLLTAGKGTSTSKNSSAYIAF